jgi:hypothetical protein
LSYAPVSLPALESFKLSVLRRAVEHAHIDGKAHVVEGLPEIYTRFVLAIDGPVASAQRSRAFS